MAKGDYTKAKEITLQTKEKVLKRQDYKSISGISLAGKQVEFHHFVARSSSGVGYEWNIVAITFDEHRRYHDGNNIQVNGRDRYTNDEFTTLMRNHLIRYYNDWSIDKCKYKKGYEEKDYEVNVRTERL